MFFLVIVYVLFVPIKLYVNTAKQHYFLQIKGLAKASVKADDLELIKVHLKVVFFNFYFYPLKRISTSNKQKTKKGEVKNRSFNSTFFRKILSLIKSFEIKQFSADIDFGDCIINSKYKASGTALRTIKPVSATHGNYL